MKFGTMIRAQRLRKNLSMDKICQQVDLSKAYLSLIETGQKTPPKDEVVIQIAKALGLDAQDLVMRAHRERYPEDVLELRRVIRDMRLEVEKLSQPLENNLEPSCAVQSVDNDLTDDFLVEMNVAPVTATADVALIRCTKAIRGAVKDLERLLPPETDGAGDLFAQIEDLRAEERSFLLHVIQGIKELRPRRGPQTMLDD